MQSKSQSQTRHAQKLLAVFVGMVSNPTSFMKSRIAIALLSCLLFSPGFTSRGAAQLKPQPPNFVFILADDLGWTELGCYSNHFNETPNLDRMAGQGMRFTQAYASAPVCSPTRAAFLTGRTPASLGITDYLKPDDEKFLSPNCPTINKQLKKAGYISGLVGKWHLNGDYARQRGTPAQHGLDEVICSEQSGIGAGDYWHPYKFMTNIAAKLPKQEVLLPLLHPMEERAGERRRVFLEPPLSGSLPTRASRGERSASFAQSFLQPK